MLLELVPARARARCWSTYTAEACTLQELTPAARARTCCRSLHPLLELVRCWSSFSAGACMLPELDYAYCQSLQTLPELAHHWNLHAAGAHTPPELACCQSHTARTLLKPHYQSCAAEACAYSQNQSMHTARPCMLPEPEHVHRQSLHAARAGAMLLELMHAGACTLLELASAAGACIPPELACC